MKFKAGDMVERFQDGRHGGYDEGEPFEVNRVDGEGDVRAKSPGGDFYTHMARNLKLVNSNKSFMQKVSTMMKKLLDPDTQTLVEAGFINGDLDLTSEGQRALWAIVFVANKAEMVAEAKKVIAESKDK